jgi:uncharacterized protein YfiM (DUF2279 family)
LTRRLDYKKTILLAALAAVATAGSVPVRPPARPGGIGPAAERITQEPRFRPFFENWGRAEDEFQMPPGDEIRVRRAPDPWFGTDKAQHFVVSFLVMGAVSYSEQHRWNCSRSQGVKWGFGLTLSLGICKEIRDLRHPESRASLRDLAADLLGAACGALLVAWW